MPNWGERYSGAALITGASSGIGRAFAHALAARGMGVVLVARRQERLESLSAEIQEKYEVTATSIPLDLLEPGAARALEAKIARAGVQIGCLVNNAGFGSYGPFAEQSLEDEARMVDLNCRVPIVLTHTFVPEMVKRARGAIIFVASMAGYQPTPYLATYGATKAFDLMIAEALWAELGPSGVDVLALCPGYTETEFHEVAGANQMPIRGRVLSAGEVVESGLSALGKRHSVIPGTVNALLSGSVRFAPRSLVAKLALKMNAPERS